MEKVRIYNIHDKTGLVVEGGLRTNYLRAMMEMSNNPDVAYFEEFEGLRNVDGYLLHTVRSIRFYTKEDFDEDVRTGRVKFND